MDLRPISKQIQFSPQLQRFVIASFTNKPTVIHNELKQREQRSSTIKSIKLKTQIIQLPYSL